MWAVVMMGSRTRSPECMTAVTVLGACAAAGTVAASPQSAAATAARRAPARIFTAGSAALRAMNIVSSPCCVDYIRDDFGDREQLTSKTNFGT
ncbi:Uncharacterised protein [Bordetella pertussis]|nr:Uncharacterised protein [Bordetella pertussis]